MSEGKRATDGDGTERHFPEMKADPRDAIGRNYEGHHDDRPWQDRRGAAENKIDGRKHGFWSGIKFLLGGPVSSVGVENITKSAAYIGGLAHGLRAGPIPGPPIHLYDDRTIDVEATAVKEGRSVFEINTMIANRRVQTRRAVYCYLAGTGGFFLAWIWEASHSSAYTRLPYVIVLLLICSLFCLSAFHNALVNWQIRTMRLGTWREFLNTDVSWWPS